MAPGRHFDVFNMPYVQALLQRIRDEQLADPFLAPGLIPYDDLADLMNASTALLNPSLYEGWSTTVEEARSAGVPMLLSDLTVHREQAGDRAAYFSGGDAEGLANLLQSYQPLSRESRATLRVAARAEAHTRLVAFARSFVDLCKESVGRSRA